MKVKLASLAKYLQAIEGISLLKEKQNKVQNKMDEILTGKFDMESYQDQAKNLGNENTVEAEVILMFYKREKKRLKSQ